MKYIILTVLVFSTSSHALDLNKYKEKIRSHMANMLGEDTTNKILGEAQDKGPQNTITLPTIPEVILDPKNEKFFDAKKSLIYTQGAKYNNLSLDEKKGFRIAFLKQLYKVTRNNNAKESELVKSLNVLEQGGNREGVYRSITLGQAYSSLESYDEKSSEALINFLQYFTPKFLRKKYKKTSLSNLNLWALKRLVTEKCLELIDTLAKNPEDVYKWYAVFSSELANNYPELWQSKSRKNTSDVYYYRWSKSAPFQHIKSEVIVKLHFVMNYLQRQN